MVKITLVNGQKEKKILVPEQKPICDILEEADMKCSPFDTVILNGKKLSDEDLEKNILELGFTDESDLKLIFSEDVPWETDDSEEPFHDSVIHPKAQIIGCACIIHSAFTPDELRDLQHYMPEAMTVQDEAGEPIFAICLDEKSPGSLTKYGAVFSKRTTSDGHATITIIIDPECDDPEKRVSELLGPAILKLIDQEKYLMTQLGKLEEKKAIIREQISMA